VKTSFCQKIYGSLYGWSLDRDLQESIEQGWRKIHGPSCKGCGLRTVFESGFILRASGEHLHKSLNQSFTSFSMLLRHKAQFDLGFFRWRLFFNMVNMEQGIWPELFCLSKVKVFFTVWWPMNATRWNFLFTSDIQTYFELHVECKNVWCWATQRQAEVERYRFLYTSVKWLIWEVASNKIVRFMKRERLLKIA